MLFNTTCNSTLEDLRLTPGSEVIIVGNLNFHDLARIIAASCTLIAVILSLYLIWMHALNYTKPSEQRHVIRIVFMVPIYALSSYFQIQWYWHAIYYQVISDCYEAFAIASFFALLCHYVGPDLHAQKDFFRRMRPVKPWVMPINWFAKCCGGQRGPWRTPKSGLTWFNIIWIGIYHYCFVRVAMTISAVVSQYFDCYCESSNSPVFGHIWIIVINASAVTIAMYCVIQFYVQLREALTQHSPFLKVLAIKLVIFLSFWQAAAISVGTSTLSIVHPNEIVGYPDLKVGIPALLLCFEMACFSILHLWAFPYAPYRPGRPTTFYPVPDPKRPEPPVENLQEEPSGGFLGFGAIGDALNLWDFVKAFGRGVRWLFCGVKRRKEDVSYKTGHDNGVVMDRLEGHGGAGAGAGPGGKSTDHLPVASQYRRSTFAMSGHRPQHPGEESVGLIDNAAPDPSAAGLGRSGAGAVGGGGSSFNYPGSPERGNNNAAQRYGDDHDASHMSPTRYYNPYDEDADIAPAVPRGSHRPYGEEQETAYDPYVQPRPVATSQPGRRPPAQTEVGKALWGHQ